MINTLVLGDLHAGSDYALVPPQYRRSELYTEASAPPDWSANKIQLHNKVIIGQREFWKQLVKITDELPELDYLIIMGDLVEGEQRKSHGAELVSTDMSIQSDIAKVVINKAIKGSPKIYGIRGTGYHTANGAMEVEDRIYENLPNIQAYDNAISVEIGGRIWDLKHHLGRSSTPYGKQTPLSKELIKNTLLSDTDAIPDADVILRAHVHYCVSAGFPMAEKQGYTTPALKCRGERYGRRFTDFYDVGMYLFQQRNRGDMPTLTPLRIDTESSKRKLYHGTRNYNRHRGQNEH